MFARSTYTKLAWCYVHQDGNNQMFTVSSENGSNGTTGHLFIDLTLSSPKYDDGGGHRNDGT